MPTKNQSAVTGPDPSLDEPCRTHRKARPASELGLRAGPSVPEFPLTLGHTRPGPGAANSLHASVMRGRESCCILPLSGFVVAGPGSA